MDELCVRIAGMEIQDDASANRFIRFDPALNDRLCRRVAASQCTVENDWKIRQICTHIVNEYNINYTYYPDPDDRKAVRRIRDLVFLTLITPCIHDRQQLFNQLYTTLSDHFCSARYTSYADNA